MNNKTHPHSHPPAAGLRLTPVRQRTLEILREAPRALGAYAVLERLAAEGFGRQPPVAYRALEYLVDHGLVHRIALLNAFAACHHPDCGDRPVFLICPACQRVAETPAAPLHDALVATAAGAGFALERGNIELIGRCPDCRAEVVA